MYYALSLLCVGLIPDSRFEYKHFIQPLVRQTLMRGLLFLHKHYINIFPNHSLFLTRSGQRVFM